MAVHNRYQEGKVGRELVAEVRKIFGAPKYHKAFRVTSIGQIQDGSGKDVSIKIEMHVPGNPKAMHIEHLSVVNFTPENKNRWPYWIDQQAQNAMKRMRMTKSRAAEVAKADAAMEAAGD